MGGKRGATEISGERKANALMKTWIYTQILGPHKLANNKRKAFIVTYSL
jgi:hypothetical protein